MAGPGDKKVNEDASTSDKDVVIPDHIIDPRENEEDLSTTEILDEGDVPSHSDMFWLSIRNLRIRNLGITLLLQRDGKYKQK